MSFNKITFSEKELSGKIFKKINFLFSNEDNFDLILNKKNGKTNLIFERAYLKSLLGYGLMNGNNGDQGMTEMFLPMIEMMFLPLVGVYNFSTLKFDEIFAGSMKADLSGKISNNFSSKITNNFAGASEKVEEQENTEENENFLSSMMSNLGQVWQKDYYEIQEEEQLDDFLVTEEDKISNKMSDNTKESVIEDIDKNLILCNFELKIDNFDEFINKINEKDPYEIFNSGKINLIENYNAGLLNGIEKVELFGENDSCIKITMIHGNKTKEYKYNAEDIVQIKEFMLKITNYMRDDDYILD